MSSATELYASLGALRVVGVLLQLLNWNTDTDHPHRVGIGLVKHGPQPLGCVVSIENDNEKVNITWIVLARARGASLA